MKLSISRMMVLLSSGWVLGAGAMAAPVTANPQTGVYFSSTQTVNDALRKKIVPQLNLYTTVVSGMSPLLGISADYKLDRYHYVGMRLLTGSLAFKHWMPSAATGDATSLATSGSGENPSSEFNRVRDPNSVWSVMAVGPRIGMEGRMFPQHLSQWSESGDFGIAYAHFKDKDNALSFDGMIFSFSAFAHYQFGPQSPWSMQFGFEDDFGWVNTGVSNVGRLPVSILLGALGISYAI